uniref:hypothetical protein n=1 Tax=Lactococcus garvieae TaxID=1363 RepID=UPI00359C3385
MSKISDVEVFRKLAAMIQESYAQGYQDALNPEFKLRIPREIAELADKEAFADPHTRFKIFIERYELARLDEKLRSYMCGDENNRETVFAYINPLTRPFVEVTDE